MMDDTMTKQQRFSLEKAGGKFNILKFLLQWEMILLYIFGVFNLLLYFLNGEVFTRSFTSIIQAGMDLSFMIFPMIFILLLGDIDVSIGSTLALSGMVMGLVYEASGNTFLAVGACLLTGTVAGFINGLLITSFKEISAVIVTIATMLFYRGMVKVVLDVRSLTLFPEWFGDLGYSNYLGLPISLWGFAIFALVFGLVLHKTSFGRTLYAIGNNKEGAYFSGIRVNRIKLLVFTLMGLMAAVSSVFYLGRSPSVVANIGEGYELKVIAICVLGGVSTSGGKGKIIGPIIGVFIMSFLDKLLGYNGVQPAARIMSVGVLLVLALLAEKIKFKK
ncbi:MAG: ABC transporter permease [Vallitaleaceae bacterium]|nr:ABC transporter permease [Vallitaleaceae bacterium]